MFVRMISYKLSTRNEADALRLGKRLAESTSQVCGEQGSITLCKAKGDHEYMLLAMVPEKTTREAEMAAAAFEDVARSDMAMVAERIVKTYEIVDWKAMAEA